jgi:hypothetical protein
VDLIVIEHIPCMTCRRAWVEHRYAHIRHRFEIPPEIKERLTDRERYILFRYQERALNGRYDP